MALAVRVIGPFQDWLALLVEISPPKLKLGYLMMVLPFESKLVFVAVWKATLGALAAQG